MVSRWEKCDLFDVEIEPDENFIKLPRERDEWLMQLFMKAGSEKDSLRHLNRVRVHQPVLFFSLVCWGPQVRHWTGNS